MNLVFFTKKNLFGFEILKELSSHGLTLSAIIIEKPRSSYYKKRLKNIYKRAGVVGLIDVVIEKLRRRLLPQADEIWRDDEFYTKYSEKVYTVGSLNDVQTAEILQSLKVDLIILGGAPIIRKQIIDIPKIGILNAHPAKLPKYRGINVIPWAVLNGDDVGVTIHFIDEGVDTGQICEFEEIEFRKDLNTLEAVRIEAAKKAGQMMGRVVLKLVRGNGKIETYKNAIAGGRQYYRMKPSERRKAQKALKSRINEL